MYTEMQGRFRIWFDYDTNSIWFASTWDDNRQKRTLTQDQADKLKDYLMGGHIATSDK